MTRRDLDDSEERAAALGDLEALLFAAARPLSLAEIARRLYLDELQAAELVELLDLQLSRPGRGLQLREAGAKWQLETKADREDIVAGLRAERGARPLTDQALETLAVVALRQPVTTEEVTAIRGAESYATIETLRRAKSWSRAPNSARRTAARHAGAPPSTSWSSSVWQISKSFTAKAASKSSSAAPSKVPMQANERP